MGVTNFQKTVCFLAHPVHCCTDIDYISTWEDQSTGLLVYMEWKKKMMMMTMMMIMLHVKSWQARDLLYCQIVPAVLSASWQPDWLRLAHSSQNWRRHVVPASIREILIHSTKVPTPWKNLKLARLSKHVKSSGLSLSSFHTDILPFMFYILYVFYMSNLPTKTFYQYLSNLFTVSVCFVGRCWYLVWAINVITTLTERQKMPDKPSENLPVTFTLSVEKGPFTFLPIRLDSVRNRPTQYQFNSVTGFVTSNLINGFTFPCDRKCTVKWCHWQSP